MLLVGKRVGLGRAVLAAYLLLVCFGHALHALPGHQHSHSSCDCESACAAGSYVAGGSSGHSHRTSDCPYGHASSAVCADNHVDGEKCGPSESLPALATLPTVTDAASDDACLICDLLGSPQLGFLIAEVDSAPIPLHSAAVASYAQFAADVLSSFSARGPPSFRA